MWDDVNLEEGHIIIKPHKDFTPKGRRKKSGEPKTRVVPLTKNVIKILKSLPHSNKYANVFLKNGKPIDLKDKSFRRWILAIVRGTPLEGMTRFHELRHTYGHIHAEKGTPRETIAALMGHSDIRTTEVYVGKPQKRLIDAVKKLEGFGRK
jgi:integrase